MNRPTPFSKIFFLRLLLVLGLLLGSLTAPLQAATALELHAPPAKLGLEPWLSYHCDERSPLSLDQAQQQRYLPLPHPHFALGFRQDACWLHWQVHNSSPQTLELLFSIDYPVLDEVDLYVRQGRGPWQHYRSGDSRIFTQRLIDSRNFVMPQSLAAGQTYDYFLRVKSSGSMTVPLFVIGRDHFLGQQEIQEWVLGLFYGISLGLLIYHLFLWVVVREKIYRFYVLHVATSLLYMATLQGLAFRLWPEAIDWNNRANYLAGYTLMLTGILFARDYLNTVNWRRGDQFLIGIALLLACTYPAQLLLPVHTLYAYLPAAAILTMLSLLGLGLLRWYQGHLEARLFILAWGLFLLMAITFSLRAYGLLSFLPIPGVLNVLQLGIVLQQVLLSLGLANRLNALKAEQVQHEQEKLREQRERETKEDFLAKMSHEIRTPMNAVLGLSQLLRDSPLNTLQRQHVELLHNAGESLLDLINDILDYSKINAGKLHLEKVPFNLQELLRECASMFSITAEQKQLALHYQAVSQLPVWVQGDPMRLRQILNNLLSNAIKFTPSGAVYLRVQAEAADADGGFTLHIAVRDTGIGLPPGAVDQLFQPFQQVDDSTTRKYGGSGLGLAISRQLVDMMQGQIQVESQQGQGSTFAFTVRLQLGCAPKDLPSLAAASVSSLDHLSVLVAEDQPVNWLVISGLLSKLGVTPLHAENGRQVLELLPQHPEIDLVLMDCEMPDMDGYETTRQLRERERREQRPPLPIIALTAHAMPEHRQRCQAAGMNDHLSKPVTLTSLIAMLQRWGPPPPTSAP